MFLCSFIFKVLFFNLFLINVGRSKRIPSVKIFFFFIEAGAGAGAGPSDRLGPKHPASAEYLHVHVPPLHVHMCI